MSKSPSDKPSKPSRSTGLPDEVRAALATAKQTDKDYVAFPTPWTAPTPYPWREDWNAALAQRDGTRLQGIFTYPSLTASDRAFMLIIVHERLAKDSRCAEWLAKEFSHDDPFALMLRAELHFHQATAARGTGTGDTVHSDAATTWVGNCHLAHELADKAYELSGDPAALAIQQSFALGMHTPDSDDLPIMEIFERWSSVDPWNIAGWHQLVLSSDERWSGDPELQLNLAGHIAHDAPEGHLVLGKVPEYIDERFRYVYLFNTDRSNDVDPVRRDFYEQDFIRDIVKTAWDRLVSPSPINNPDHAPNPEVETPLGRAAFSNFVFCLSMCGFHQEAFEALWRSRGYYRPGTPWVLGRKVKRSVAAASAWRSYVIYNAIVGPGFRAMPQLQD